MSNNIERFVNRHIKENINKEQLSKDSIITYDETLNLDLLENDTFYNIFENELSSTSPTTNTTSEDTYNMNNKSLTNLINKVKEQPKTTPNSSLKKIINKIQYENTLAQKEKDEEEEYFTQIEETTFRKNLIPSKNLSINLVNKFFNPDIIKLNNGGEDAKDIIYDSINDNSTSDNSTSDKSTSNKSTSGENKNGESVEQTINKYITPSPPKKKEITTRIKKLSIISNQPDISKPSILPKYKDVRSESKQKHLHYILGQERLKKLMSETLPSEETLTPKTKHSEEKYILVGSSQQNEPNNDKRRYIKTILKDNFGRIN